MVDQNIYSHDVGFQGVKGLIFVADKIIAFRRDNKTKNFPLQMDLPGGGREDGESPFETFRREVREEFGINVEKTDIIFAKKYQSVLDSKKEAYFLVTKSLDITEADISFGNEGVEFKLMFPQEFVNLPDGVGRQQDKVLDYINSLE